MNILKFDQFVEDLVSYSYKNLSSLKIIKNINYKLYQRFLMVIILSIVAGLLLVIGIICEATYNNGQTLLLISCFLLILDYFYMQKYIFAQKKMRLELQEYRYNYIKKHYITLKITNDEIKYIADKLDNKSQTNKLQSLRVSAAFAILLLPIWDIILNKLLFNNSIMKLETVLINLFYIFLFITISLAFYLVLEKNILVLINYRANVEQNISQLSRLILIDQNRVARNRNSSS